MNSLTRALNRTRDEDEATKSEEDESDSESQNAEPEDAYAVIQEMLSIFDDRRSPEEYGHQEIIRDVPTIYSSLEDVVVLNSLSVTIYGLARHDRKLRRHLRIALNKEFCAAVHLSSRSLNWIHHEVGWSCPLIGGQPWKIRESNSCRLKPFTVIAIEYTTQLVKPTNGIFHMFCIQIIICILGVLLIIY